MPEKFSSKDHDAFKLDTPQNRYDTGSNAGARSLEEQRALMEQYGVDQHDDEAAYAQYWDSVAQDETSKKPEDIFNESAEAIYNHIVDNPSARRMLMMAEEIAELRSVAGAEQSVKDKEDKLEELLVAYQEETEAQYATAARNSDMAYEDATRKKDKNFALEQGVAAEDARMYRDADIEYVLAVMAGDIQSIHATQQEKLDQVAAEREAEAEAEARREQDEKEQAAREQADREKAEREQQAREQADIIQQQLDNTARERAKADSDAFDISSRASGRVAAAVQGIDTAEQHTTDTPEKTQAELDAEAVDIAGRAGRRVNDLTGTNPDTITPPRTGGEPTPDTGDTAPGRGEADDVDDTHETDDDDVVETHRHISIRGLHRYAKEKLRKRAMKKGIKNARAVLASREIAAEKQQEGEAYDALTMEEARTKSSLSSDREKIKKEAKRRAGQDFWSKYARRRNAVLENFNDPEETATETQSDSLEADDTPTDPIESVRDFKVTADVLAGDYEKISGFNFRRISDGAEFKLLTPQPGDADRNEVRLAPVASRDSADAAA